MAQKLTLTNARLTKDAVIRTVNTKNGAQTVADLGLAVNEYRGTGEARKEITTFYAASFWNPSEKMAAALKKGRLFTVIEGDDIKVETFELKSGERKGEKVSQIKFAVRHIEFPPISNRPRTEVAEDAPVAEDSATPVEAAPAKIEDDQIPF